MTALATALSKSDKALFGLIHSRLHCRLLDLYFGAVTHLGSTPAMILLVSAGLVLLPETGEALAWNLAFSQAVIHASKRLINRPRPYRTMTCNLIQSPPKCVYSFPSGHAGAAFSAALVLAASFPALAPALFLLAASIGLSRIYLGYHFFSDVLAGALIAHLFFQLI